MDADIKKEIDKIEKRNLIASRAYDIGFMLLTATSVFLLLKMFLSVL